LAKFIRRGKRKGPRLDTSLGDPAWATRQDAFDPLISSRSITTCIASWRARTDLLDNLGLARWVAEVLTPTVTQAISSRMRNPDSSGFALTPALKEASLRFVLADKSGRYLLSSGRVLYRARFERLRLRGLSLDILGPDGSTSSGPGVIQDPAVEHGRRDHVQCVVPQRLGASYLRATAGASLTGSKTSPWYITR
jgi:hypothetical protein